MFEHIHHVAYIMEDADEAVRIFHDLFELEIADRRVTEGEQSVEMVSFHCGPTLIEVMCPIHNPGLERFLDEHGPGLHHIAFAMRDLPKRIEELKEKGVFLSEPSVAWTGWTIARFDGEKSGLSLFEHEGRADHVAEGDPSE